MALRACMCGVRERVSVRSGIPQRRSVCVVCVLCVCCVSVCVCVCGHVMLLRGLMAVMSPRVRMHGVLNVSLSLSVCVSVSVCPCMYVCTIQGLSLHCATLCGVFCSLQM
jgi:hypothetical protein